MANTMRSGWMLVLALAGMSFVQDAEAWEGTLSTSTPTLVFEGLSSLDQLDGYVLGGTLGGSWMSPAKSVQVAVLDTETADTRIYQMQINDNKGVSDCHLKVAFVTFTVGEGGIYAVQSKQGYVSNKGPQLIGQKVVSSGGGYSFIAVSADQYSITALSLSEFLSATISGDTAWSDIAWDGGATWIAGPARLSGEGTVTVTDDVGATKLYVTSGNLTFTGSNTFANEIIVQGGTVTAPLGYAGKVTIDEGAVYDVAPANNTSNAHQATFVLNGGTLANNGPAALSHGAIGLQKMSVIADSKIGGSHNMYAIASQYGRYDLNLNGHTLTKIGADDFNFYTANLVGGGAFVAEAGTLRLLDARLDAGVALTLTAREGAILTLENNNKGGGVQIVGDLDIVNEGTVYLNPARTVRNYTHKGTLSSQGVTVNGLLTLPVSGEMALPAKITLGDSASLALEGEGTLVLGENRPTLTAVPAGVTLDVSASGTESLDNKIKIPTTLETAPTMTVSGAPATATVEDGYVVIEITGSNVITVEPGQTMTITAETMPSSDKVVVVPTGATLDIAGTPDTDFLIVLQGGTLKNSGNALSDGTKGCWNITLTADSTIDASSNFGSIAANHTQHEIHLNGHTLTKIGANSLWLSNAKFTGGGTFKVAEGTARFFHDMAKEDGTTVALEVAADATVEFVTKPHFATMTGPGLVKMNFYVPDYYNNFPEAQGFGGGVTVEIFGEQTGYFKFGSFDVNMKLTGTFQISNGYTYNNRAGVDQATYLKSISGEGTFARTGSFSARPLVCAAMANFTGTINEDVAPFFQPYYLAVEGVNYYSVAAAVEAASARSPKLKLIPVVGAIPSGTEIPDGWHVMGNAMNGYSLVTDGFSLYVR